MTRSRESSIVKRYPSSTKWIALTFIVSLGNLIFDVLTH